MDSRLDVIMLATLLTVYNKIDWSSPETVQEQFMDCITEMEMEYEKSIEAGLKQVQ